MDIPPKRSASSQTELRLRQASRVLRHLAGYRIATDGAVLEPHAGIVAISGAFAENKHDYWL